MSLYSVEKLMSETRRLAADYHKITNQALAVSGEIAKFDCQKILNLKSLEKEEKGVDLIGVENFNDKKFLVKSRVIFDGQKSRQMVGQINLSGLWDAILLVLMDEEYNPQEIYMCDREDIVDEINNDTSSKGSMSVAKFKIISKLVWDVDLGVQSIAS